MSLHVIWGIRDQFSQIAPIPEYLWNRFSSIYREPWHYSKVSFDVKQWAEDFGLFFMCPCTWFGVFGPSFAKLPQYLSTCETDISRPTEGLDTSIWSHLMWNRELKTLNFFLSDYVLDLGVFGPFPQNCPNAQVSKNRYNSIVRWSWQKSRSSFDVNCGAEDYGLL